MEAAADDGGAVMDALDMAFLLILLQIAQVQLSALQARLFHCLDEIKKEERRASRSKPTCRARSSWAEWSSAVSDTIFRRMFRMPRDSFNKLCELIEDKIGKDVFKSESWLAERVMPRTNDATDSLGGFVSGQFKIAVMLRILAGASYLDLLQQYCISTASVYSFFHEGIKWIIATFEFPLVEWLREENWEALNRVSDLFAAASGDVFKGCIGALDGLAIKIRCPTLSTYIPDPGNYFCRKGFYALNVQAICDKLRRILWVSTGHKGSTHDSTAFNGTKLTKEILEKIAEKLREKGFFFVADSAYPLLVYMLTPFADVAGMSPEDAFNFWLSNARIQIECAFGMYHVLCHILLRIGHKD